MGSLSSCCSCVEKRKKKRRWREREREKEKEREREREGRDIPWLGLSHLEVVRRPMTPEGRERRGGSKVMEGKQGGGRGGRGGLDDEAEGRCVG